jgi:hypothetical protein
MQVMNLGLGQANPKRSGDMIAHYEEVGSNEKIIPQIRVVATTATQSDY